MKNLQEMFASLPTFQSGKASELWDEIAPRLVSLLQIVGDTDPRGLTVRVWTMDPRELARLLTKLEDEGKDATSQYFSTAEPVYIVKQNDIYFCVSLAKDTAYRPGNSK